MSDSSSAPGERESSPNCSDLLRPGGWSRGQERYEDYLRGKEGRAVFTQERAERGAEEKQGRIHGTRCAWYAYFSPSKIKRDEPTDRRMDGRTDTISRRDATAHLKRRREDRRGINGLCVTGQFSLPRGLRMSENSRAAVLTT